MQNKCENRFYYANICKHKHENNMTMLWCKIVRKISIEQTDGNEESYFFFENLLNSESTMN